jgi:Protein of unknown function (DUF3662)/Inner membrane component of T3SS, cytoplasmic domain
MNPLRTLETTLASLVEGTFGRVFRSEVRPMELARKLAREMDEHRTTSVSRVYAPNEYAVWLSPEDRERYEGVEEDLIDELCAYLLEHARGEQLTLLSHPVITFHTDEELALGEFGIQARLVRLEERGEHVSPVQPDDRNAPLPLATGLASAPPAPGPPASAREEPDEHGQTMIYSTSRRLREPLAERTAATRRPPPRALLLVAGRRLLVAPRGAVIGRSRECDVVLDDSGISRRHAQLRPTSAGWTIEDLGSTNGVLLNDEPIHAARALRPGDRLEMGSTKIVFELR